MTWSTDDGKHEGWAAAVAPDGRVSGSSTYEGMLVEGVTGRYKQDNLLTDYEVVPHKDFIGWRAACTCGWRGVMWERVRSSAEADLGQRREYVDADDFADATVEIEDAVHVEWKAHVAPWEAVAGVEVAAREYVQAGHRLDKTVAAAKAAGTSWADIGRAVGISRQAAHERWAGK